MSTLSQKLTNRIGELLRRGRFQDQEALIEHALDLVAGEDKELCAARNQLSEFLESRMGNSTEGGVPFDIAEIKARYGARK